MADLNFSTPVQHEQEDAHAIAHNSRLGIILFFVYCLFYGGFIGLSAFSTQLMSQPLIGKINLSVSYGFFLIAAAIVLALVYMKLCKKTGKEEIK